MNRLALAGFVAVAPIVVSCAFAQSSQRDSGTFTPDGTAYVSRVVPMPSTISPEAQKWLDSLTRQDHATQTLSQRRAATDEWRKRDSADPQRFPLISHRFFPTHTPRTLPPAGIYCCGEGRVPDIFELISSSDLLCSSRSFANCFCDSTVFPRV